MTTELLRHRVESIRRVRAALARFTGSPDLCEECEEPIGEKRPLRDSLGHPLYRMPGTRRTQRAAKGIQDVEEGRRVKAYYASVYRTKKVMMPSDYLSTAKKKEETK